MQRLQRFTGRFVQKNTAIVESLRNDLGAGRIKGYANCCEALKTINVPVLIIAGQKDPVTTVADAQYMVNQIPNSKLAEINASHISNIECPEDFTQALSRTFH